MKSSERNYLTLANDATSTISSVLNDNEYIFNDIADDLLDIRKRVEVDVNMISDICDDPEYLLEHPESFQGFDEVSDDEVEEWYDAFDSYMRLVESLRQLRDAFESILDAINRLPIDTDYELLK